MSHTYVAVQWNKRKLVYDAILIGAVIAYLTVFHLVGAAVLTGPHSISGPILAMRAWGSCAFLMLTAILCLGPLARLDRRFLPLLYNRRHFGVLFFFVALQHARLVLGFYHAFGKVSQLDSYLGHDVSFTGASVPFQLFGGAALAIFGVMAVSSHDFWQKVLGARFWKSMHMLVYLGYLLVVAHVAFGALQFETHPLLVGSIVSSIALVTGLHLAAALRAGRPSAGSRPPTDEEVGVWIDAGPLTSVPKDGALRVANPGREDIALVRSGDLVSAVHGVCAHQGGPLAEGKVLDGCLTCPWHGWQYLPGNGQSPPPFTEKLPTYRVRLDARGHVLVEADPRPAGTECEPLRADRAANRAAPAEFFVGYLPMDRRTARFGIGAATAIAATMLLVGSLLAAFQRNPGEALRPERDGLVRDGLLLDLPYPHLRTLRADGGFESLVFTGIVKNEATIPSELVGRFVRCRGDLFERGELLLFQAPGEFEAVDDASSEGLLRGVPEEDLGTVRVRGEIVDSKCYAGRMRPGVGHGHRACAQLCVAGGVPPVLVAFDADGTEASYLLASVTGGPVNDLVVPYLAEPVEVEGRLLLRRGDLRVLQVAPAGLHRR